MRIFTCLIDPEHRGIPAHLRHRYETLARVHTVNQKWCFATQAAVLTATDTSSDSAVVETVGDRIAVGFVRLDNRDDVLRWLGHTDTAATDLCLVLQLLGRDGPACVRRLLGDFAFVYWDPATTTVIAAVDAFSARRLYYRSRGGVIAFASRADCLATDANYDLRYLAQLIASQDVSPGLTVYTGVAAIPGGCAVRASGGASLEMDRYWDACAFERDPVWARSDRDAVDTCRSLLSASIRMRIGSADDTWAQLSGGLDSSSIVSLTQWLAQRGEIPHGLAGTVTYVDRQGTACDERAYSDAVVRQWGVRNEVIADSPTWHEEGNSLPLSDQPRVDIHFSPRDRRMADRVRAAGGRVLLTGWGGDELLMGTMLYFADWIANGRVWSAVREMARIAAIGRVSFWELAYKNAVVPLLPRALQRRLLIDPYTTPGWLKREAFDRLGVALKTPVAEHYAGHRGRKYRHAAAMLVARVAAAPYRDALSNWLDVRHPFLYRPLVEFTLCLPPHLRARPHAHRWVLREAMRGILPDKVCNRVGKPETSEVVAWALDANKHLLGDLVRESILSDLGLVDADQLRAALADPSRIARPGEDIDAALHTTLSVEAWLQMRSGRWPRAPHPQYAISRGNSPALSMGAT